MEEASFKCPTHQFGCCYFWTGPRTDICVSKTIYSFEKDKWMIPVISFIINMGVFELCQWVYVGNLQKAKSHTACAHSPCSNTQGHNSCQKVHGVSRNHIWFIFPLFFCHVTFRQLLLTPSFSCTWSHAHSLTLLSFFISLLCHIANSTLTFLMMSSSQSLPDCSLAGLEQTLKGRGAFTWDGLLLTSCQLKFDESIGDPQHTYPQPSTLNSIYIPFLQF